MKSGSSQTCKIRPTPTWLRPIPHLVSYSARLRMVRHLIETGRPTIVLFGNGMCSSGHIVNFLKATPGDKRHNNYYLLSVINAIT